MVILFLYLYLSASSREYLMISFPTRAWELDVVNEFPVILGSLRMKRIYIIIKIRRGASTSAYLTDPQSIVYGNFTP